MSDGTTWQEPDVGYDVVADGAIDTVGRKSFPGFTGPPGESPAKSYNRPYETYVTDHGPVEARGHR